MVIDGLVVANWSREVFADMRAGGVTAFDRIDVQPWLESKERFSFVSSDPLAADLDCFRDLAANGGAR